MNGLQSHYAYSCSYLHDVKGNSVKEKKKMTSSYFHEPPPRERNNGGEDMAVRKSKSVWWWNEAERKRQRRVARYKFYATEGKIKHSFKKGFRWFKLKCIRIVTNL
ncbi:uncharacterized protein LOC114191125 [Vigna unguiculata]|uniref:Uncharacterized protein n=1 Tax=Vigna unguiculata TaxID=3917 RepID=A0A4D6MF48_VIGUN|nr:uncharacterized protein LOC114191125 [Vigna unguiculata]QCD98424.1 hypothetical protein DEO72_LG6g3145 [Vigna unguiculata]